MSSVWGERKAKKKVKKPVKYFSNTLQLNSLYEKKKQGGLNTGLNDIQLMSFICRF